MSGGIAEPPQSLRPDRAADAPDRSVPDAVARHWADRRAPLALRPYLRLARIERPIGWWLLLLPCWWSAALAAIAAGKPWPDPVHCLLFWIGAVAMRGAGSTYNDIVDRKLDARVERTRWRPLPSGQVSVRKRSPSSPRLRSSASRSSSSSTASRSRPASPRSCGWRSTRS